jgi:pentatricopeptide repeat protein
MQQIEKKGSIGLPIICVAVVCTAFSPLPSVLFTPFNILGDTKLQATDLLLFSLGVVACLLHSCSAKATERITKVKTLTTAESLVGKADLDSGHRARRAVPAEERAPPDKSGNGSSKDLGDRRGHESMRLKADMRTIDCARSQGVAHKLSKVLEVMHACIRLGHGDMAVKLFDQMAERGAVPRAHLIHKAVSNSFFQLVAETLDDKRIQKDGLLLLDLVLAHGIDPSATIQNRLLAAWKSQLPECIVRYFLKLKSAGVILSRWAYRCIVVTHERSDPKFALKVYSEMEGLGIELDRVTYNAVLGARSRLGMHDKARELYMQMADHAVVPNEKTYGIMIKVYSASNRPENALALFETMREQSLEPDRYAYHHAIRSCIALQRIEYAVGLYREAVHANAPLCMSTYALLSGACKKVGWNSVASTLDADLSRMQEATVAQRSQA